MSLSGNGNGGPWWGKALERFGFPAAMCAVLLYALLEKTPSVVRENVEKLTRAIETSATAQIEATKAAELRAEQRTRDAVQQLKDEFRRVTGGK